PRTSPLFPYATLFRCSPLSVDGEIVHVKVRAGYCAVRNFADSPIDPTELLLRASTAMRQVQPEADAHRIKAFDDVHVSNALMRRSEEHTSALQSLNHL